MLRRAAISLRQCSFCHFRPFSEMPFYLLSSRHLYARCLGWRWVEASITPHCSWHGAPLHKKDPYSPQKWIKLSLARLLSKELWCRIELPNSGAQWRPEPEVWLQVVQRTGEWGGGRKLSDLRPLKYSEWHRLGLATQGRGRSPLNVSELSEATSPNTQELSVCWSLHWDIYFKIIFL